MQAANQGYTAQGMILDGGQALKLLADLFASRYEALMPEVRHDILEAALLQEDTAAVLNPRALKVRIAAVEQLGADTAFVHTATRPANIVAAAEKKGVQIGEVAKLDSAEGETLLKAVGEVEKPLSEAAKAASPQEIARLLQTLASPINAFFDSTMVMVEDEQVRSSRLGLLRKTNQALRTAGDFTKIVIEG
jgi:glycyl-tRNA synthetase beta chain